MSTITPKLVVLGGPMDGAEFSLNPPATTIGRLEDQSVSLPLALAVSRRHARLIMKDDEYWLEDVGSSHGTFVSGSEEKIIGLVRIKPGTTFRLGPFTTLKLITDDVEKNIVKQVEHLMEQLSKRITQAPAENLTMLKDRLTAILNQVDKVVTEDDLVALMQEVIVATREALSEPSIPEQQEVQHLANSLKESSEQAQESPQKSILKSLKTFLGSSLDEMIDWVQTNEPDPTGQ